MRTSSRSPRPSPRADSRASTSTAAPFTRARAAALRCAEAPAPYCTITSFGTNSGSAPAGCWAPPPTVVNDTALTTTRQNKVQELRDMHTFPQRGGLHPSFVEPRKCRLAHLYGQFIPRTSAWMAQQCTRIPAPEAAGSDRDTLTFVISSAYTYVEGRGMTSQKK